MVRSDLTADALTINGSPPAAPVSLRYPELYALQPGQSVLYRWTRFRWVFNPAHTMRSTCYYVRRTRGWEIRSRKHPEGIWVERRS